jgi:hypothetical protein
LQRLAFLVFVYGVKGLSGYAVFLACPVTEIDEFASLAAKRPVFIVVIPDHRRVTGWTVNSFRRVHIQSLNPGIFDASWLLSVAKNRDPIRCSAHHLLPVAVARDLSVKQ